MDTIATIDADASDVLAFSETTLCLAVQSQMQPAVTLGQGLPETFNELPVHYRWVRCTVNGRWVHPNDGQIVDINPSRVRSWVTAAKLALSRGFDIVASKVHKGYRKPENTMGNIFDARERENELELLVGYYGDDSLNMARKNKVSLGVEPNVRDSRGNTYKELITHLAATPVPVLHGLPGFVALSREPDDVPPAATSWSMERVERVPVRMSDGSTVVVDRVVREPAPKAELHLDSTQAPGDPGALTPANAGKKGVAMFSDTMKARVAAFTGKDVGDDLDAAMAAVLDKAEPATTQVATLSRELADAKETHLANEPVADPRIAKLVYRAAKSDIEAFVAKGELSKDGGVALLSLVEESEGNPNVTLLSREGDDGITIDKLLAIVPRLRKGLLGKGEATGVQLLSREVPDAEPVNDNKTQVAATLASTELGRRAIAAGLVK